MFDAKDFKKMKLVSTLDIAEVAITEIIKEMNKVTAMPLDRYSHITTLNEIAIALEDLRDFLNGSQNP